MIYIDLDADLSMEDDEERNITVVEAVDVRPPVGSALIAGRPKFWSWVVIDAVEELGDGKALVTFHQVSAKQAASVGPLVVELPRAV